MFENNKEGNKNRTETGLDGEKDESKKEYLVGINHCKEKETGKFMPGNKQTEVTLQMLKDELSFNSVFQANMPPVFVMTYRS